MHEIEYYDAELRMSSYYCNGEWYLDKPTGRVSYDGLSVVVYWDGEGGFHRDDGGPAIEYSNGTKKWVVNDEYHRIDGPAIEWSSGGEEWRFDGILHRDDGPALIRESGEKKWFIHGFQYTEAEFLEQCTR